MDINFVQGSVFLFELLVISFVFWWHHEISFYIWSYLSYIFVIIYSKNRPWWILPKKQELMLSLMDAQEKDMFRHAWWLSSKFYDPLCSSVFFFFWHSLTCYFCNQVRFELPFFAPNPKLEWDIIGREDAIEYAKKHNVPIPVTKKSIYSRDRNLWHLSHEVTFTSPFPVCWNFSLSIALWFMSVAPKLL